MTLKELIAILRDAEAVESIDRHREDILDLIPKARIMVGFNQRNHAHQYDLWTHLLNVVADAKAHIMIPIIEERIEICEKLAGKYSEELYRQILAGK